ncbi:[FeFe] hydrogenase, group A [Olsenella sp. DNF00959]|uniref:[FeFe] hydrogenase, group A n=1 Tax=Olsenella sp. DNF00959 TaxID=1476999 RepID=UPI00079214B4|nr:[FeFe] hydrogenase, group A [Olsenella sp. DNF00959]KXB62268.1 putative ferredoxin hydrogenase HydA1 [Olsenella sp. DNF00959]
MVGHEHEQGERDVATKAVSLVVDGTPVTVPAGTSILDACRAAGSKVPTLCYLRELNEIGSCRVCVVEVKGRERLVASCNNCVEEGMEVLTNSPKVRCARRENVLLLLSQHDATCTTCVRSGNCSLQEVSNDLGLVGMPYPTILPHGSWPQGFPLIRNNDKCIRCMRCIQVCDKVQASHVWGITNRATHTTVDVADGASILNVDCTLCGQCITHCPVGALRERDDVSRVYDALQDPEVTTVVQIAPSVRTSWGDHWGLGETAGMGRLVSALRHMGFDYVVNTDVAADLTIMEEGTELLRHLGEGRPYPLMTSCCPAWVRFVKAHHPELVDDVSTSKSPQQMFGAVVKSYYAQLLGLDPHKVFSLSIMPCVAKKAECAYPNMNDACGDPDVDCALTVRELERLLRADHVDVASLGEEPFDEPLGVGTGAGIIFGATGGVMEAALRTAHYLVSGRPPKDDMFGDVRGLEGWKEASFDLAGTTLRVAVAHGLANADALCKALVSGEAQYDFVEVMACPGGCVGGGGQPIHEGQELAGVRGQALYGFDRRSEWRNSYESPAVRRCYEEFFGEPNSELAEELLHTDLRAWKMPAEWIREAESAPDAALARR